MDKINLSPIAYQMHKFLLSVCVGENYAIKGEALAGYLGLKGSKSGVTRTIRKIRAEINSNLSDIQRMVLTSSKGYYVASSTANAQKQYKEVAWRKIKQGVSLIQEGKRLLEHSQLDGQTKLKLSEYMKEVVEIGA